MSVRRLGILSWLVAGLLGWAGASSFPHRIPADEPPNGPLKRLPKAWQPRLLAPAAGEVPLANFVDALITQTGNKLADRRTPAAPWNVPSAKRLLTFWQALEHLSETKKVGFSPYQSDGGVALVNTPLREMPRDLIGPVRIVAKRVVLSRDDEIGAHLATVHLDVAWEPRLQPFHLALADVRFVIDAGKETPIDRPGKTAIAGRSAIETDIVFAAPPRSAKTIRSLSGTIVLTGPSQMLEFTKPGPADAAPIVHDVDGVKITMSGWKNGSTLWRFQLTVDHPADEAPRESFETFLSNHRVWLEKKGTDKVQQIEPSAMVELGESPKRATFDVVFGGDDSAIVPRGTWSDWTIRVRVSRNAIEGRVPFRIENIELP